MGVSRRQLLQLGLAPPLLARANAQVADLAPTASRVYPGADGRLAYVPDDQGNTIHDASHAGYRGGGVALPTVPVRETIWPVAGDNTQHVQAAIDRVSARPRDAAGLRGAILLRAGYYRMASPLRIQASGVVLRGEGTFDGTTARVTATVVPGSGEDGLAGVTGEAESASTHADYPYMPLTLRYKLG